jgi:hypothetical protein
LIVCLGDFREIKRVKTHEKEEAFTTMSSSNASFPGSETLLDFAQPFDVTVLDAVVNAFYSPGGNPQLRAEAEQIMKQMQEHEHSWTRVDGILEHSKSANTKFSHCKS